MKTPVQAWGMHISFTVPSQLAQLGSLTLAMHDVMGEDTCSEMDIWSSGPRMATLPAIVVASVSKITLHEQFSVSTGCAAHILHRCLPCSMTERLRDAILEHAMSSVHPSAHLSICYHQRVQAGYNSMKACTA